MPRPIYIYALADPETDAVHYVGLSRNPQARYAGHVHGPNGWKVTVWSKELRRSGKNPTLVILETVTQGSGIPQERAWIEHYKAMGHPVMNSIRFTTCTYHLKLSLQLRPKIEQILAARGLTIQEFFEKAIYEEIGRAEVSRQRKETAVHPGQLRLIVND